MDPSKDGITLIQEERQRQLEVEGWTDDHDDSHENGDLGQAAVCYARHASGSPPSIPSGDGAPTSWPWQDADWKPKDRITDLQRAGALIAAEIDRLRRSIPQGSPEENYVVWDRDEGWWYGAILDHDHRVMDGPYDSQEEAIYRARKRLQSAGIDPVGTEISDEQATTG